MRRANVSQARPGERALLRCASGRSGQRGLTAVEASVALSVLGILLAILLPAVQRQARYGKTSEAITYLNDLCAAQSAYYAQSRDRPRTLPGQESPPPQFVNAQTPTPAAFPSPERYPAAPADWESAEWVALGFSINDPHYFQYASPAGREGFSAVAHGNLDGDNLSSTFLRTGRLAAGGIELSPLSLDTPYE
jgi:type II secretory pathway pseudopilin PulG